jgi:K+-sensing histidine kinase KdpD
MLALAPGRGVTMEPRPIKRLLDQLEILDQPIPVARSQFAVGTRDMPIRNELPHSEVARIVHDFKTPLATILLEAELLEAKLALATPIDARRAIDRIARNTEYLGRMVMDLLDLCNAEAGHLDLRRDATDVRMLVERVVERVVSTHDTGRIMVEPGTSPMVVLDDLRIERVVANLLENALKYAPKGTCIKVLVESTLAATEVSVIDIGRALTVREMVNVFDEYKRGGQAKGHEGSGLGLYVSKKIIEAHGGAIGVESMHGTGTRFFFTLPTIN